MKYIFTFNNNGIYVNRHAKRGNVSNYTSTITAFPGFNVKVHTCIADSLESALQKLGLTQYEAPVSTPIVLKAWQAKAVLASTPHPLRGTMLSQSEELIASMPDSNEKTVIASAFANNADFTENSPTVIMLATQLGLKTEDLHSLFVAGKQLKV